MDERMKRARAFIRKRDEDKWDYLPAGGEPPPDEEDVESHVAFAAEEVGMERERTIIECAEFIEKWRPCICNKKFDTTCGHAVNCYWYISYGIRELARDGRE